MDYIHLSDWSRVRAYSRAITFRGEGRWVVIAGCGADVRLHPDCLNNAAAQWRIAWATILSALERANAGARDVVRLRTYVTDSRYFPEVANARKGVLGDGPYPVHTFLVVSGLAEPSMLVEIEAEAFIPDE